MNYGDKNTDENGIEKPNKKLFWVIVILGGAALIVKTSALYIAIFKSF